MTMLRRDFNRFALAAASSGAFQELKGEQTTNWYHALTPGIHLDYHYPDWDPYILSKADGAAMIEEIAATGARMVVVFAKCHYGNSYYTTRVGHQHHNLGGRDLFAEWVREARRRRLIVLAYYSVDRDIWAGKQHPEWRMKNAQGETVDEDRWPPEWAAMGFLCYNSPYLSLVKAQVEEILEYDIDGFHFDMLWYGHTGTVCHCDEYCKPLFRRRYGIEIPKKPDWSGAWRNFLEFRYESNERFAKELTALVRRKKRKLSAMYNYHGAPPNSWQEGMLPVRHRRISDYGTGEGYPPRFGHHYASLLSCFLEGVQPGSPWQGVTSRYTRTINDHTVRPLADMQWETFTYLAHGGMPLFVDTPGDDGGTLDPVAYSRMTSVFREIEAKKEFFGHEPMLQVGLYFSSRSRDWYGRDDAQRYLRGFTGAHRILVESHIPVSFLFDENLSWDHLRRFSVLYLANAAILTKEECALFWRFVEEGGCLLATSDTGKFDEDGKELPDFRLGDLLGVRYSGKTEFSGNYFSVPEGELSKDILPHWDVFIEGPNNVVTATTARPLGALKVAFHDRDIRTYIGHAPHNSPWKAVGAAVFQRTVGKGRTVYLPFSPEAAYLGGYPLPEQRVLVRNIITGLSGNTPVIVDAPLNVESVIRIDEPRGRYLVHLIQFSGVADGQSSTSMTTLIPQMEEPMRFTARIHTRLKRAEAMAADADTTVSRDGDIINVATIQVHTVIAISY